MEMELNIKITGFSVDVKPQVREDNIKAFVTWIFHTSIGEWKIYNGTLRQKPFGKNQKLLLSYEPPAVGKRYSKVLFIDNKIFFQKLCQYTKEKYYKLTGELENNFSTADEEVNLDEIPL